MNSLKCFITVILAAGTMLAHAEFSATTLLASDYVSRGISNTDGNPAIQGSMDYEHDTGFYAGIWASNVKFRENADADADETVDEASIEIEYYAGFASEFGAGISWDIGALYYTYPGTDDDLEYEYWEAMGALGYAFGEVPLKPEIRVEIYHSPEYFGDSGDASYATGILHLSLPEDFRLDFSIGKQWFKDDSGLNYTDWKIGVSRPLWGFDLELAYTGTNLGKSDCDDDDICDDRAIFSIARTYE